MYRSESKNFYYDIKISTPDGKKSARLTDTLMKMCIKADIVEAVASEQQGQSSSLVLTFIEADFLPDSLNKTPAEGIDGRGYITNRTGALIDLRFDGEKGFTYVTPAELESGITRSSRTQSSDKESVKFMFSANNIVEITWGHLEPKTKRTRKFKIGVINYSAGANGNQLNLQCYDLQKDMSRIKLDEGKTWVNKEGKPQSLKQILYSISQVFGARLEFDEQIIDVRPGEVPSEYTLNRTAVGGDTKVSSNDNPVTLLRNQNIDSWLKELAGNYNSIYEIYDDPFTGNPVIKFTSKVLRYQKVVKTLNYRDPNGVMLDFQFNSIAGTASKETASSAIDEDGESESLYKEVKLTDGRDAETPPTTYESIPLVYTRRAREELERELVGTSITAPDTTESSTKSIAETSTVGRSFMGYITVKTVGHPDFKPDVMKIEGVGVRASTTYRFYQVQHSLSASGYVCTMQGKTQEQSEQGTTNEEKLKGNTEYIKPRLSDPKT